ncbi:MAG: diguanylate cyclase [Methanosarcinaceae archaeon]|nr:diguanylate cyclase [Methanosarcinaceae archaeon]
MIIEILTMILIVLGGFSAAFLAVYGFSHRKAKGAISFAMCGLLIMIWSFTYTFSILSLTPSEKFFWIIMRNIGLFGFPVAWLFFALDYTGRKRWIKKNFVILACILPLISLAISATNELHGLYYSSTIYERNGIFMNMNVTFGVWFWIQSFVSYLLIVIGLTLITLDYLHSPKLYRRQTLFILAGVFFAVILNIAYAFFLQKYAPIDITPVGFSVSVLFVSYGLFYGRTFDLIPIAHQILVESMQDNLIVLDDHERIIDINPSAEQLIGQAQRKVIGKSAHKVFDSYPDLKGNYFHSRRDITLNNFHYDLRVTNVFNDQETLIGRMILLRDITEEVKMFEEIQNLATIDSLTGIYNRRHFFELANNELSRKSRGYYPVSLIMMDVDHFKEVNDRYGHQTGDRMLNQAAQLCKENIRQYDIVGRYGGEEFVILMPSAGIECANKVAERICKKIEESFIEINNARVQVTVSLGIACMDNNVGDITLDQLIMRADKALYAAKADGRNQVVVWDESIN